MYIFNDTVNVYHPFFMNTWLPAQVMDYCIVVQGRGKYVATHMKITRL